MKEAFDVHTAIDGISAVLDMVSAGLGGAVVDVLHGMLYYKEYKEETEQPDKSIIFIQMCMTFASVLLPAISQAISVAGKQSIGLLKKDTKLDAQTLKSLRNKMKPILNKIKEISIELRDIKNNDNYDKWLETANKVDGINENQRNGYIYTMLMIDYIGLDDVHYEDAIELPKDIASKIGEFIKDFIEESKDIDKLLKINQ